MAWVGLLFTLFGIVTIFFSARKKPNQGQNANIYSKISYGAYTKTGQYITGMIFFMLGIFIILAALE